MMWLISSAFIRASLYTLYILLWFFLFSNSADVSLGIFIVMYDSAAGTAHIDMQKVDFVSVVSPYTRWKLTEHP